MNEALSRTRTLRVVIATFSLTLLLLALGGYDLNSCLEAFWKGSFGSKRGWGVLLTNACPLMLTGVGVAIAFRCGALNIGAEGQLLIGTLFATALAVNAPLSTPLLLLSGALGGALWAGIAGILRMGRGVPEVLSTILLNFIAVELVKFSVTGPLEGVPGTSQTHEIPPHLHLHLLDPHTDLHTGILLAIATAILAHGFLFRTVLGFELRVVGAHPVAAEYAGISVTRSLLLTLLLSGALSGLAGTVELLGRVHSLSQGFTSVGYGYTAIAVAMLARLNPLGVVASAIFFGGLAAGSREMTFEPNYVPDKLVEVVRGLMVLLTIGYGVVELRSRRD